MFSVIILNKDTGGILEVNGPYEKREDAVWFKENCVPYSWHEFTFIKNMTKPEYVSLKGVNG